MFVSKAIQNRVLGPGELFARAEVHGENSFVQYEKIANPEVLRRQVYEEEVQRISKKSKYFLKNIF